LPNIGEHRPGLLDAAVAPPLLLECDRNGQIVWLSAEARMFFGGTQNLVEAFCVRPPAVLRFSLVLEQRDRVLIGADVAPAPSAREAELEELRDRLLVRCFRLENAERSISAAVRQIRPRKTLSPILQIDELRRQLGRELHTGIGQLLVAVKIQADIVETFIPNPIEAVRQALGQISSLVNEALEQVRAVARSVHPPAWGSLTLEGALRQLWGSSGVPQRVEARLDLAPLPDEPVQEIRSLLFGVAQEAISNLLQYSKATRASMTLAIEGKNLVLRIEDNGVGFVVSRPAKPGVGSGLGLRSLREQASSVGGELTIESSPGSTRLEVRAPYIREGGT